MSNRKSEMEYRSLLILLLGIAASCIGCSNNANEEKLVNIKNLQGEAFAGSKSCQSCHLKIYESHLQTPHFNSSHQALPEFVKASFESGKNEFIYSENLKVVSTKESETMFQVAFVNGQEVLRKPIDLVIGSGRKGQSYLFWNDSSLYQLPLSYFTPLDTWSNSPGYPSDQALFNRPITGRCIECHGTYANTHVMNQLEIFDSQQLILGVDCERCHAPAAKHIAFHSQNSTVKEARYIINAANLTRQQRLDACALCHSGERKSTKPIFSFTTGDRLDDFSSAGYQTDSVGYLDVHGNQYGLLTASKCFLKSEMDCSSCHNVHQKESNQLELFSQRCMNCHQENKNFCSVKSSLDIRKNCIDCHMPALPSRNIVLNVKANVKNEADLVRTHLIAIYSQEKLMELNKIAEYLRTFNN
jgi:hypothetical protein